jgi:membrane-associated phospholipid phosphatase
MSIIRGFEVAGDILQFALPATTWISDILPDMRSKDFQKALKKTLIIAALIIVQNRGGAFLKKTFPKQRPNGKNNESFPSGHAMIAAQSTVRLVYKYGFFSKEVAFGVAGSVILALGRYLPGQHDIIDLTAGAFLGSLLGAAWNQCV